MSSPSPTSTPPLALTITCTSEAALNGTYAASPNALEGIQAEVNAILLAGATPAFSDGTTTLNWPDRTGALHAFDVAHFHSFAVAMALFVRERSVYEGGGGTAMPTGTATIA